MKATRMIARFNHLLLALSISIGSLLPAAGTAQVALAADPDAVTIAGISLSACGAQTVAISGTGTYSEPTQHLVVTFDGTELMDDHDELAAWSAGSVSASVGSHTVVATIYDKSDHVDVMAIDTEMFTVSACGGSTPASGGGPGDQGPGGDCCPGPDPVVPVVVKKGAVKGASTVKVGKAQYLKPLNRYFRQVYGRNPTYQEWKYWSDRFQMESKFWKNGHPAYNVLVGAMQWHKMRGRTMGR